MTSCLLTGFGSVAAEASLNDACHDLACNLAPAPAFTGLFRVPFQNTNLAENIARFYAV